MKYSKKRLTLFGRLAVVGGIFFALFIVGYYTGYLRENCKDDIACFDVRAQDCRPTEVVVVQENNVYQYIVGNSIGACSLSVTLKRVEAGASAEFQALQGKKMTCKIPKGELDGFSVEGFDEYMHYCHGLLKEELYRILLQRVYTNLVGNMGAVIKEAERVLKN